MKKRKFGEFDGRMVDEVTLESADAAVSILNFGCVLRDWRVDGPSGTLPMALGFPDMNGYDRHSRSHGAIVGRIANRTRDSSFDLEGKAYALTPNDGPGNRNHLHGGAVGLGRRVWDMETEAGGNAVHLSYASPDGEEGYPGAVRFEVTYRLEGPRLICEMRGVPDRQTPINLAHHAYFNLGGGGTVNDHVLWLDAPAYTPVDADLIPLGTIEPVEGTNLDFRAPRKIGNTNIDNNFVLREDRDPAAPAASATCPRTGLKLQIRTDQPGLQIFDAATMTIEAPGHGGEHYGNFAGLCLEAQRFPDSMHNPDWPSILCTPENPYFQRYVAEIGPES